MGSSSHEGVKIPFQLPPGMANECQLTFSVKSFLVPQKLRGTVVYMAKVQSVPWYAAVHHASCSMMYVFCIKMDLNVQKYISPAAAQSLCIYGDGTVTAVPWHATSYHATVSCVHDVMHSWEHNVQNTSSSLHVYRTVDEPVCGTCFTCLSGVIQGESGTASEKLDFSLYLPCSAFICPIPCAKLVSTVKTLLNGFVVYACPIEQEWHHAHREFYLLTLGTHFVEG